MESGTCDPRQAPPTTYSEMNTRNSVPRFEEFSSAADVSRMNVGEIDTILFELPDCNLHSISIRLEQLCQCFAILILWLIMDSSAATTGYSARVRLELWVDNLVLELASVAPSKCVLREAIELPACDAEIAMFVDDHLYTWPVRIPNGAVPFDPKVWTQSRGEMMRHGPQAAKPF